MNKDAGESWAGALTLPVSTHPSLFFLMLLCYYSFMNKAIIL